MRNHKSRVRPHETSGPYTLSRGNSNHSLSSQDDLDDESWIMPHDVEGQHLARSETSSPLMTAMASIQEPVMPLRLDIPEEWSMPTFQECSDGLFGDVEQPLMSASLSAEAANWEYSLPFPAFPAETNIDDTTIDSSRHSLLTLSSEDQVGLEAVTGINLETLNDNFQQSILFQQPIMSVPSETDFFAEAWEPQEYALNANIDLNDFSRDTFFQ